jgi:lipopolysaccharide export system protein LptA
MYRTLRSILTVALAVLFVASAVALTAVETVSGTVENVDPQQGRMILRAEEGKAMELRAPTELLIGLQNGDAVEVKISGQRATFIQKQEGAQRPDMGGALRLQPPIDMPKSR